MKTSTKVSLVLVCAALAVGAALGWAFLSDGSSETTANPKKKRRPPLVEVEVARAGEIARRLEVTGEVVATNTVVIRATKEGPVAYSPWREGDEVRAGDKLVEIDREVHRAEVQTARAALELAKAKLADLKAGPRPEEIDQARANVKKWRATLQEARAAYQRQRELRSKDFTSEQAVDQALERREVAQAELANAEETLRMLQAGPTKTDIAIQYAAVKEAAAKLELAQAHLEECVITAPFDAVITRAYLRPGDLAIPRSPLVEMFDPASLVVRFSVPEARAAALRPGLPVEAQLDAIPGKTFHGEVDRLYPQLDAETRTRTVEATLEKSELLMPHQFARVTLTFGAAEGAIIVPAAAVRETAEGRSIAYVIEDGKAVRRMVQTGIEQAQRVQILKGIKAGERVVVTGSEKLKDGAPVRVAGVEQKDRQADRAQKEGTTGGQQKGRGGVQ